MSKSAVYVYTVFGKRIGVGCTNAVSIVSCECT